MEDFQEISFTENPSQKSWKLEPLFRHDANGRESTWQIGFDGVDRLVMRFGKVGGVIRNTKTVVEPKGKRDMQEQALQEARHRYDEKIRKDGYHLAEQVSEGISQPMLAQKWIPEKTRLKYPVIAQAKLDGIRCLALRETNSILLRSRNNKPFYYLGHIRTAVKELFAFLPDQSIPDGEFYSLDLDFNTIASITRQKNQAHPGEVSLSYWIFDLILLQEENKSFIERYNILVEAYNRCWPEGSNVIKVVPIEEANSAEDLLGHHDKYVQEGYEGLIIRKPESKYKFGRGSNLLKYKEFTDEEAEVIDVEEAKGTEEGAAILVVRDIRDNELSVRFRGSMEQRRMWLQYPDEVIGKKATIRYQETTPDGKPRFPVGIAIRDYE
jgi:ATP-dependent DNA ligase